MTRPDFDTRDREGDDSTRCANIVRGPNGDERCDRVATMGAFCAPCCAAHDQRTNAEWFDAIVAQRFFPGDDPRRPFSPIEDPDPSGQACPTCGAVQDCTADCTNTTRIADPNEPADHEPTYDMDGCYYHAPDPEDPRR